MPRERNQRRGVLARELSKFGTSTLPFYCYLLCAGFSAIAMLLFDYPPGRVSKHDSFWATWLALHSVVSVTDGCVGELRG